MENNGKLYVLSDQTEVESIPLGYTALPFTFWLEHLLQKENIPFLSISPHVPKSDSLSELFTLSGTIAREWYRLPEAEALVYEQIRIGEVLEPMFDFYLGRLLYYIHTFESLLAVHNEITEMRIPDSTVSASSTSSAFAPFEVRVMNDALVSVGKKYGITVSVGKVPTIPLDHVFPKISKNIMLS